MPRLKVEAQILNNSERGLLAYARFTDNPWRPTPESFVLCFAASVTIRKGFMALLKQNKYDHTSKINIILGTWMHPWLEHN
jgi:hypothetical protein